MKCPKCEKEVGMVDICPLCGEKTIVGEGGEMITPSANTPESGSEIPTVTLDEQPQKKKFNKRLVFEIIGGFLLFFFMMASFGSVPKSDLTELQAKYDTQAKELKDVKSELTSANNEYNSYKEKMKPYEELQSSEAKAKKIEADKIIADKKAADEKAAAEKKAAEEKAAADKKAEEDKAAAEKKAADDAAAAEAAKVAAASTSQKNAVATAKSYLAYSGFSYSGLVGQLEFEGFSNADATYAADNCGADWNKQAEIVAKSYMDYSSFSRDGLIDQLVFEGFSQEQAEHGVSAVGY